VPNHRKGLHLEDEKKFLIKVIGKTVIVTALLGSVFVTEMVGKWVFAPESNRCLDTTTIQLTIEDTTGPSIRKVSVTTVERHCS
jgi:hypothetical protein